MLRDPEVLSLGYNNPFKPRGTGKPVPSSLENDEEWSGLVQHVKMFLTREKAKNRGKGGMMKPWTIVLVDMGKDASQAGSKVSGYLKHYYDQLGLTIAYRPTQRAQKPSNLKSKEVKALITMALHRRDRIPKFLPILVIDTIVIVAEKRATSILARHLLINLLQWSNYRCGHLSWYVET